MKLTNNIIVATATIISCCASASAAVLAVGTSIGVDFGPTASTNDFNDAITTSGSILSGSLIDISSVVVDDVAFTWAGGSFPNNDSATEAELSGQPSQFNDSNLTDWIGENNTGSISLAFSGLDDSLTYDLVIGSGFVANGTNVDTIWTADGQSATTDHGVGANAYVTLTGLSTDGSGNLVITSAGTGTNPEFTVVSALQLTAAVPEPSSTALLGLGGLALILRRRR